MLHSIREQQRVRDAKGKLASNHKWYYCNVILYRFYVSIYIEIYLYIYLYIYRCTYATDETGYIHTQYTPISFYAT